MASDRQAGDGAAAATEEEEDFVGGLLGLEASWRREREREAAKRWRKRCGLRHRKRGREKKRILKWEEGKRRRRRNPLTFWGV